MVKRHLKISPENHRFLKRMKGKLDCNSFDEVLSNIRENYKKKDNFDPFKKNKDYY